jgi:hypothetical protein
VKLFGLAGQQQMLGRHCHDAARRFRVALFQVDPSEIDKLCVIRWLFLDETYDGFFGLGGVSGFEITIDQEVQDLPVLRVGGVYLAQSPGGVRRGAKLEMGPDKRGEGFRVGRGYLKGLFKCGDRLTILCLRREPGASLGECLGRLLGLIFLEIGFRQVQLDYRIRRVQRRDPLTDLERFDLQTFILVVLGDDLVVRASLID